MTQSSQEEPKDPLLMEHDADGIKELDNKLPRWWVWLFYLSIAFAAVYLGYYHVLGLGDLQAASYDKERQRGEILKLDAIQKFEATIGTLAPATDPEMLSEGRQIYATYCLPCHREDGGGLVGPNLCDDYWIHGSNFVDNVKIIINGVPEKGMITWRGVLRPTQIQAVASFIQAFRGSKPPNPKPPENLAPASTGPSEFE